MKTTGLSLKEAVDSGRKFKHKEWSVFIKADDQLISIAEALSSDWMLEKKEISREDVVQVWQKMRQIDEDRGFKNEGEALEVFLKELGL